VISQPRADCGLGKGRDAGGHAGAFVIARDRTWRKGEVGLGIRSILSVGVGVAGDRQLHRSRGRGMEC